MDYGYKLTDKKLEELEKRIASVYREAAKNQRRIAEDYFKQFVVRDKLMQAELEAGKITEEYYKDWKLANIGRGKRFEAMRDELAERATKANEVAIAYVNDTTPSIWTLNANYAAYTIENHAGNVGFTLFEENAVERLIVERPDVMPYYPEKRAVNRGIDIAYGKRQITAQVTSSILTGDSVGHMADALMQRITTMERTSAIRAARTACTNAMNAGRQMQFEKAQSMGIRVKKRWRCVHDARTRAEHGDADGQIREIKEPYEVGGEELMFPADNGGSGWNIYNCRCRSENFLPDYPRDMGMTYNEWMESKNNSELFSSKEGSIINEKKIPSTKISQNGDVLNPMDKNLYDTIKARIESKGKMVTAATKGSDEYAMLEWLKAEAITDEFGIIHMGEIPSKGTFFEEIIHLTQFRKYGSIGDDLTERALREVAANRKLLKNASVYKLDQLDISDIKANLEYWENDARNRLGMSYDDAKIFR